MKHLSALAVILLCLPGAMCSTTQSRFPNRADVEALVKPRPKIPAEALDPDNVNAATRYQNDKRSWEDDLVAAGGRVCRYLKRAGMDVTCPTGSDASSSGSLRNATAILR